MIIRDPKYIRWLHSQPCLLTGIRGAVDPMHIGTAGKGLKSSDDEAMPVSHHLHAEGHQHGEISMLRKYAPDYVLRMAFRALAREMYRQYKEDHHAV